MSMKAEENVSLTSSDFDVTNEDQLLFKLVEHLWPDNDKDVDVTDLERRLVASGANTVVAIANATIMLENAQFFNNLPTKTIVHQKRVPLLLPLTDCHKSILKMAKSVSQRNNANMIFVAVNSDRERKMLQNATKYIRQDNSEHVSNSKAEALHEVSKRALFLDHVKSEADHIVEDLVAIEYIKVSSNMKQDIQYLMSESDFLHLCIKTIRHEYQKTVEILFLTNRPVDSAIILKQIIQNVNKALKDIKHKDHLENIRLQNTLDVFTRGRKSEVAYDLPPPKKRTRFDENESTALEDFPVFSHSKELEKLCSFLDSVKIEDVKFVPENLTPEMMAIIDALETMGRNKPKRLVSLLNVLTIHNKPTLYICALNKLSHENHTSDPWPKSRKRFLQRIKKETTVISVGHVVTKNKIDLSPHGLIQPGSKPAVDASDKNKRSKLPRRRDRRHLSSVNHHDNDQALKYISIWSSYIESVSGERGYAVVSASPETKMIMLSQVVQWYRSLPDKPVTDMTQDVYETLFSRCVLTQTVPTNQVLAALKHHGIITEKSDGIISIHIDEDKYDDLRKRGQERRKIIIEESLKLRHEWITA